ncbi:beta-ketoacyl synthase N-terminal-like domain-containing protein, partial [Rhodococcus sp. NPDC057014]
MTVTTASETRKLGRPVVVTGFAAATSIADDADGTWEGLLRNQSGIGSLDEPFVDDYDLPVRIGGKLTA